ncbi:hypothetical protein R3P38DRAFT_2858199 [Favolaschia claudopus]|uniref:MYND-type domain-containing protein n=1 Tax=Favolaschia claudopus TaxID=2862362 RepID=A0AAW0DLT3_9AGAR
MPPKNPPSQDKCAVCNKLTAKKCSRCMNRFYCSAEHQKHDWKKHKAACLPPAVALRDVVKTRAEAERDGDTTFVINATLLPWDSETPCFVKVVCEVYEDSDDDWPGGVNRRALSTPFFRGRKSADIATMGYDGPALGYTLSLVLGDMFLRDGSPLNRCVVKLRDGKAYHPWGGNLIAYRVDEPTSMVVRCNDAKAED